MVSTGSTSTPRVRGENPGHDQERRFASGSKSDFARVVAGPGVHPGHGSDGSFAGSGSQESAREDRSNQARGTQEGRGQEERSQEGRGQEGEAAKKEPEKAVEAPPPTIPKDVEEKLEKARRAVAEAIVAAQDAGLVETSIDPPPILDILIKGYAIDARTLKNPAAKKTYWAVTPEVFCALVHRLRQARKASTINPHDGAAHHQPERGAEGMVRRPCRRC